MLDEFNKEHEGKVKIDASTLTLPSCSLLNSSSMAFMRTPSPPLRKSHQTMVSVACAAPTMSVALANVAHKTLRIMSISSHIVLAASPQVERTSRDQASIKEALRNHGSGETRR